MWLTLPTSTTSWRNVDLMLDQRRRSWTNIKPTLSQRLCVCWQELPDGYGDWPCCAWTELGWAGSRPCRQTPPPCRWPGSPGRHPGWEAPLCCCSGSAADEGSSYKHKKQHWSSCEHGDQKMEDVRSRTKRQVFYPFINTCISGTGGSGTGSILSCSIQNDLTL